MISTGKTLLVLGGTSDIGRATAKEFAAHGWAIQLAGRDLTELERNAADLAARFDVAVNTHIFDVLETASFRAFATGLPVLADAVVCAVGLLGEQVRAETDLDHATLVMRSNYEGPSLILGLFAELFLPRGSGTIIGVSSVAGDRGRATNYVYGSAKAGFTAFLSGLRNRCARHGVHVITVKPGFVRSKMTEGMKLPERMTTTPEVVAKAIFAAEAKHRDVVYVPFIWSIVMLVIRHIPEPIFKKLKI